MDSTLLAALFGAAVASIGVTLAKDTKVSEFRQAWIDKLREDVAEFISLVSRAFDEAHNPYVHALAPAKKQDVDDLTTIKDRLNTVMYRIVLRLDLKDAKKKPDHPMLLNALSKAQALVTTTAATRADINAATDEVWTVTAALLDTAWERVKAGEPRYRWVLRISCATLLVCFGVGVYQIVAKWRHPDALVSHFTIDAPVTVKEQVFPVQPSPPPPTSGK